MEKAPQQVLWAVGPSPVGLTERLCAKVCRDQLLLSWVSQSEETLDLARLAEPAEGAVSAVFFDAGSQVVIGSIAGHCWRQRQIFRGFPRKCYEHSKV